VSRHELLCRMRLTCRCDENAFALDYVLSKAEVQAGANGANGADAGEGEGERMDLSL